MDDFGIHRAGRHGRRYISAVYVRPLPTAVFASVVLECVQ
jgi:hypothetical protein